MTQQNSDLEHMVEVLYELGATSKNTTRRALASANNSPARYHQILKDLYNGSTVYISHKDKTGLALQKLRAQHKTQLPLMDIMRLVGKENFDILITEGLIEQKQKFMYEIA